MLKIASAHRKDLKTAARGVTMEHLHFAVIAATLREVKPSAGHYDGSIAAREQWVDTVKHFAETCAVSNPKFDRERFLAAAGWEV